MMIQNKFKHIISILLTINLFLLTACTDKSLLSKNEYSYLKQNKDITVGVFINYPPFEFVNENGSVDGLLIEYLNLLEDKINHKFKKKFYDNFQLLLDDAKKQKIDIVLDIQKTEQRSKYFIFTEPVLEGNHVIVFNKNNPFYKLKELYGKKVAVCDNYAIEEYLQENHPKINLIPVTNDSEGIDFLLNGKISAIVSLESSVNYVITKQGHKNLEIGKSISYVNKLSIGINKNKPTLANIIKKANQSISFEEKNDIFENWFFSLSTPILYRSVFFKVLILVLSIIIIIFFIATYLLRKEVKKRTKELNYKKLEAEKNTQLKTLFLQNISTEIEKPLKSIKKSVNLLKDSESNDEKQIYLNTLLIESSQLTTILNNIIEISQLNAENIKPTFEVIALDTFLNTITKIYTARAEQLNLQFSLKNEIDAHKNLISSDKSILYKSIINLLDNAFQIEDVLSVSLEVKNKVNTLLIHLKIKRNTKDAPQLSTTKHQLSHAEENFGETYDTENIGLAIAHKNIKLLNGKMSIKEDKDNGLEFKVKLPVIVLRPNKTTNRRTVKDKFKILIAEDMKLNYLVLEKTLKKVIPKHENIQWAKNGQEAVDLILKQDFDIVFMDIKMPVLDGFDATQQIKQQKPETIVVAQTAYTREEDLKRAKFIGFDGYLTKPIDPIVLKATIEDLFSINA